MCVYILNSRNTGEAPETKTWCGDCHCVSIAVQHLFYPFSILYDVLDLIEPRAHWKQHWVIITNYMQCISIPQAEIYMLVPWYFAITCFILRSHTTWLSYKDILLWFASTLKTELAKISALGLDLVLRGALKVVHLQNSRPCTYLPIHTIPWASVPTIEPASNNKSLPAGFLTHRIRLMLCPFPDIACQTPSRQKTFCW